MSRTADNFLKLGDVFSFYSPDSQGYLCSEGYVISICPALMPHYGSFLDVSCALQPIPKFSDDDRSDTVHRDAQNSTVTSASSNNNNTEGIASSGKYQRNSKVPENFRGIHYNYAPTCWWCVTQNACLRFDRNTSTAHKKHSQNYWQNKLGTLTNKSFHNTKYVIFQSITHILMCTLCS
jgi:hypothetical protein